MKCPNCEKEYTPKLKRPKGYNRDLQDIYPEATKEQREQIISGLCSTNCWNIFMGVKK
jgi:hypothetical protein